MHPLLPPDPDQRTSEEIVAQVRAIDPRRVVGLKIFGDGLRWEWDRGRDRSRDGNAAEEMIRRIGGFFGSLREEDVFPVPTTFDYYSHVVRHGISGSLHDGSTFRFQLTLFGEMHPDEPPRRAMEALFTIWPPRLGALYEPSYGPMPAGAMVPRFFRTVPSPPDPEPLGDHPWLFIGPPETGSSPEYGPDFSVQGVGNWYLRRRSGPEGRLPVARLQRLAFLAHGWHLWAFGRPLLRTPFVIGPEGPVSPALAAAFGDEWGEWAERLASFTYSVGVRGPFPPLEWSAAPVVADPGAEEILEFVWDLPEDASFPFPHPVGVVLTDREIHAEFQRRATVPGAKIFRTFKYYERTPFPP